MQNNSGSAPSAILVDAYAMIYRAYFAFMRSPRINSKGVNTSAVYGFMSSFVDLVLKRRPDYAAVAFDLHGPTFRHDLFPDYKANRQARPEDIAAAVPFVHRFVKAVGVAEASAPSFEADDVIGTLSRHFAADGCQVLMVTPDKDYAQLIAPSVSMLRPHTGSDPDLITLADVKSHFGVDRPDQVIDLLGLWGDSSDNIPGCPGVGEKRAKELIASYGSIDGIYAHLDDIKGKMRERLAESRDQVLLSRRLATIVTDAPVSLPLDDARLKTPDWDALEDIFRELEIRSIADRIRSALGVSSPVAQQPTLFNFAETTPADSSSEPAPEPTYATAATTPHAYHLVNDDAGLVALRGKLLSSKLFCFDTETTSVETASASIVGFSVAVEPSEAWFVRLPSDAAEARRMLAIVAPAFANPDIAKVGQNMKFDISILSRYGVEVRGRQFDTMIAHFLLRPDARHNMDAMAMELLSYRPIPIEDLIGSGAKQLSMSDVPDDKLVEYAAEDADITLQLYNALEPKLHADPELEHLFETIEMPLVPVLADMELQGVAIDSEALHRYADFLRSRIKECQEKIFSLAGAEFNVASPKQVGEVLFEKLKIDPNAKKTKSGGYSTNEETLQKLASEHPIVAEILTYRGLVKLLGTYAEALPKLVNPLTGRIHTSFNQTVVVTGRLSSSNPNLQNIPVRDEDGRRVRECFVAKPNCKIVSADYSQVELRIMAHFSQDEHLLAAFRNGDDIHAATAARIFGCDIHDVTSDMRRKAKTANFGIIYGISAFGLAERLDISRREAKELIDGYFAKFPGVKAYMDKSIEQARQSGVVKTLFGRRRYLPDISSRNQTVRGMAERNAINAPIQGTAADIIKLAMIAVHDALIASSLRSRMILQVHDELVLEVPDEELEAVSALVKEKMEAACQLSVPLTAEVGVGDNWLQAH